MQTRIPFRKIDQNAIQALQKIGGGSVELEQSLIDLVIVRASQINHCAFCLNMHMKDARASGETEQRLYSLSAWRETPIYSDRERAALLWTESLTQLGDEGVPDSVYEAVRQHFSEEEMVSLTMSVIAINSWNRLNIGLRPVVAGTYKSHRTPAAAVG